MRLSTLPVALAGAALAAAVVAPQIAPTVPAPARAAAPATAPALALRSSSYPVLFGLSDKTTDQRHTTEQGMNVHSALVGYFSHWTQGTGLPHLDTATNDNAVPLVAWMPTTNLDSVLSGSWDSYARSWLRAAKAWGHPMIVRFMPEMNASEPYAIGTNGNTSAKFVAAWKHVVSIARNVGATNVKWMWNPDRKFKGSVALKPLYPGNSWVDWVGIDAYNFGTADRGGWISFKDLVAPTITAIRTYSTSTKPIMIAEVGCAPGSLKPTWMTHMFSVAPTLGVRAVLYFDFDMARDWRIMSSSASLSAARTGIHAGGWSWANSTMTLSKIRSYVNNGL